MPLLRAHARARARARSAHVDVDLDVVVDGDGDVPPTDCRDPQASTRGPPAPRMTGRGPRLAATSTMSTRTLRAGSPQRERTREPRRPVRLRVPVPALCPVPLHLRVRVRVHGCGRSRTPAMSEGPSLGAARGDRLGSRRRRRQRRRQRQRQRQREEAGTGTGTGTGMGIGMGMGMGTLRVLAAGFGQVALRLHRAARLWIPRDELAERRVGIRLFLHEQQRATQQ